MRNAVAIGGIALFAFAVVAMAPSSARADNNKKVFVETGDDGVEMVWIRLNAKQASALNDNGDSDKVTVLSRIQRAVLKKVLGGSGTDYKWSKVALRVSATQLQQPDGSKASYVVRPKSAFAAKKSEPQFEE